jgi:hypothetical protein
VGNAMALNRGRVALGVCCCVAAMLVVASGVAAEANVVQKVAVAGRALGGGKPLGSTRVTLYRTASNGSGRRVALGDALTRADGSFSISYAAESRSNAVLYLLVGKSSAVRLAAVLGAASVPRRVVVNERTTVAMGFALAQFIAGRNVAGRSPGPQNGAAMAADLVDVRTGGLSPVLATSPNGGKTSTLRTFNSLANMLVPCVRSVERCRELFTLATPPGGKAPTGTLDAIADIARNPADNVEGLSRLARSSAALYRPALRASQQPDAWTLALRFDGDGKSMNGPGNMAIDARGNIWVTGNYTYSRNPLAPVCGSKLLFELTPAGGYAKGSPFSGGGLDGAGFGITFDPQGNLWLSNFGFASSRCPSQPPHLSVSKFGPTGDPLSPPETASSSGGYTTGGTSWPQGTVSDRKGNIWIANCGNDSVTRYGGGNPAAATNLTDLGIAKPFDIAINLQGQVFVTGNGNDSVAMLNPDGSPTAQSPITGAGLKRPLGIAADSRGNMWVASSGVIDVPCPDTHGSLKPNGGAITLIASDGTSATAHTGGGLTIPWGIAVDGNDNIWVADFYGSRLSEFCGTNPAHCPPAVATGEPISPASGFGFDGLARNTGVQIDPSGNVWVANNWKTLPVPNANPGGYEMVAFIGLAGPLETPLIGPPSHS